MNDEEVPFDVAYRGPSEPEIIVVGGVHGDETGGVKAVQRLRDANLEWQRGVALVLANPEAIDAGTRYVTSDLNRVFPGDAKGNYEERLAARLCAFIEDRLTLSLHGTRSSPTPFALINRDRTRELEIAASLPIPHVVDYAGSRYGTITLCGPTIEIEVGAQGTEEAAVSAEQQARAFLRHVGALPGEPPHGDPDFYQMGEMIPKPDGRTYEVFVENFEPVAAGETFAAVDGEDIRAEESFVPVLVSADGYPDILGYQGEKIADSVRDVSSIDRLS